MFLIAGAAAFAAAALPSQDAVVPEGTQISMFREMDADGDGFVSLDEVQAFFVARSSRQSQQDDRGRRADPAVQARLFMGRFDANRSGSVSPAEFDRVMRRNHPEIRRERARRTA